MGTDQTVPDIRKRLRPRKSRASAKTESKQPDWYEWNEAKEWAKTNLSQPPPGFGSSERNALLEQIQQIEDELDANNKKKKLRGKAMILQQLLQRRVMCAGVRLLPPEILSHIFSFAVPEAAQFPSEDLLSITQTCRRWRQIAMNTPILWTCVNFFMDKQRTKDFLQKEGFSQENYLNEWFDRSGNLMLSIAAVGHGINLREDVFKVILSKLHRVTRLALLHCSQAAIKRFFTTGSAGQHIRQLDLGAGCEEAINNAMFNIPGTASDEWGDLEFPVLETAFLHSLPADLMLHVHAPNLLHLSFARCWTCPYYLNAISKAFPRLTHLKFMSFSLHQHDSHLLSVSNAPGIPLIFPELTHFLWLDPRAPGNPNIAPFSAENINLQTLSLSPNLKFGWIEVRVPTFIKPGILRHLIDLKLQVEVDMHYEVARRIFSGMDNLRVLSIERTRFASSPPMIVGILTALSMTRIDLSHPAELTYSPDGPPKLSLDPVYPPLCRYLERLNISDCKVCPPELLRFSCLRRIGGDPVMSTSTITGHSLDSVIRHEPRLLPKPNVKPCSVTLKGCPDAPEVEKALLPELTRAFNSMLGSLWQDGLAATQIPLIQFP